MTFSTTLGGSVALDLTKDVWDSQVGRDGELNERKYEVWM